MNRYRMIAALLSVALAAGEVPKITADAETRKGIEAEIRAAEQDKAYSRALRAYAKLLEFFPNEPLARAPIYLAMSDAVAHTGDDAKAAELRSTALAIDPSVEQKVRSAEGERTRGAADRWAAVLQVAAQTMTNVQQARAQYAAQQMQNMQQQAQFAQQQAQYNQQMTQFQRGPNGYRYPAAPVGATGYVPPEPNTVQPMPGFAPPQAGMQLLGYDAQGQPVYGTPLGAAQPQPQVAAQQTVPMQQGLQPGGLTGQTLSPQAQMAVGGGLQPNPYAAPAAYQMQPVRGESFQPARVIYDRSLSGAQPFQRACGALLNVDAGANLTLTSGCNDTPVVVPASDISEIRLNTVVGKEAGVFHIATKKGLYLAVLSENASREESQALVARLRAALRHN